MKKKFQNVSLIMLNNFKHDKLRLNDIILQYRDKIIF